MLSYVNWRWRLLKVFWVLLLAQSVAFAQWGDSALPAAPIRLRIQKNPRTPWPAAVGVVKIAPCWNMRGRFGVFTADGRPVAFQTLWSGLGELTCLRFDTSSGATEYYVCYGPDLPPRVGDWKPESGVVVETRPAKPGMPINSFPQISRLLSVAGRPAGRDYVRNIFLGLNPFGPSVYYIATFKGWFEAPKTGRYTFATASDDASYLQVDGRLVAQFLGAHGAWEGAHGEHSGVIRLQAGVHRLDYLQIQLDGAAAAVAAWKPPGQERFEVMPPSAFLPVAHFHPDRLESSPSGPRRFYFEWQTVDHCAIADSIVVRVRFRVLRRVPRVTYRWRFDDGDQATGPNVLHCFPETGLRQVTLNVLQNGAVVATETVRVRVEPNWSQINWWRDDVFNAVKRDFLRCNLTNTPPQDLLAMLNFADRANDPELLRHIGEAFVKRSNEFDSSAYGIVFYKIGMNFECQGDRGDALAEQSLRLALSPKRSVSAIADKVRLRLADVLIHDSGKLDEAGKLLDAVTGSGLLPYEKRLWQLLQGDLLLARGQVDAARRQYLSVEAAPDRGRFDAARAARLLSANILFEHDQLDEAQQALDGLELGFPLERMSLGSGLLDLRLALKRKEFRRAYHEGRTLLAVANDDPRQAEVLCVVVEASLKLGKTAEAQQALRGLLKDFPASASAARAKDLWDTEARGRQE